MNFELKVSDADVSGVQVIFQPVDSPVTVGKLDEILANQAVLINQGIAMSVELDALEAEVAANTAVDQSAITLLNGLAAQITALKNDPVKLQAFADSLRSSSADLAAAVAANTPGGGTVDPGTVGTI